MLRRFIRPHSIDGETADILMNFLNSQSLWKEHRASDETFEILSIDQHTFKIKRKSESYNTRISNGYVVTGKNLHESKKNKFELYFDFKYPIVYYIAIVFTSPFLVFLLGVLSGDNEFFLLALVIYVVLEIFYVYLLNNLEKEAYTEFISYVCANGPP